MKTTQGNVRERAEDRVLGIPTFKRVIEDEEVIKEIGKYPKVGKELRELCQGSQKRSTFQQQQ